MGGELIRRGPRNKEKMDPEGMGIIKRINIAEGNARKRPEPFLMKKRGWEARRAKQFPAENGGDTGFVHAADPKSSRIVKIGDAVKTGSRVPELGPRAEKKALAALNKFGNHEIDAERFSGLMLGRDNPTMEELGSIYLAMRKSKSKEVQYCLFRMLQEAVKHGTRRMRKAADQCLDTLLEQGITDYRRLQ